ncbi:MAG: zinc carboxypeptidase [Chitinophagaceae bacterium]|nr:zinc carboxypeptidase [Chitinophagaceae bacterium]
MRKWMLAAMLLSVVMANAQSLDYYLPKNVSYNPNIPTPKSVIYHEVGEWHVTHDRLVNYMKALDAASDRISLQVSGYTYEGRPQLAMIITSPKNHAQIETIRKEHLKLSDANQSSSLNLDNMPIVVWQGYSIHGNESSGSNAALLTAYYLAAAQGAAVEDLLEKVVIIFDPSFNPDGLNRFANWANMHKSKTMVADPQAREFNEVWPGGRFNHYWFDLNRDWLPAQHVESRSRLKVYHDWKPNILTDHHEQGSNATFFFQPGVPSRVNPNTPNRNQELTAAIGNFHAKFLDSIGSMYFTKEGYDDFYYGKGSTYPDINGAVGILFEQASSRGHAQETDNGLLTFPFTIRNQFVTSLSTLEAARALRKEMLAFQRDFYKDVAKESEAFPVKAYVFGDEKDKSRTNMFIEMLQRHQVKIYSLKTDVSADGKNFKAGQANVIPTAQQQFKIIKTVFEKTFEYKDSLFYDVTAWTMSLAFGLPNAEIKTPATNLLGDELTATPVAEGKLIGGVSSNAYIFRWDDYYAPKLLYRLQSRGLITKVATQKFGANINGKQEAFGYGSIVLPVKIQNRSEAEIFQLLNDAIKGTGVDVYSTGSSLSVGGVDLGSNSMANIRTPRVMMFGGTGTSATDVGEIWHLMDQRFGIPVSIVDVDRFNAINTARYNVIIMPSGSYNNLDKNAQDKLRTWIAGGGTLIATEDATNWLAKNGMTKVLFRDAADKKDSTAMLPYYLRSDEQRAKDMAGSLFEAKLDPTHPLCYGYNQNTVTVFKSNTLFMDQNNDPYDSPVMYTDNPLQSGYLYRGYRDKVKNTAVVNIDQVGRGRVVSMVDNLNFRAFWLGTSKIFLNAVVFGEIIRL